MGRNDLIVIAALAAGCSAARHHVPSTRPAAEYRIGREDVLEVVVWREPELTRVVPVRPDGKIGLPLVGELQAAGRTPAELRAAITDVLQPLVKEASVTVLVREINGPKFYVMGEVHKPGAYPLRGPVSIVQALATAGGLGEFAGREVVWLRAKGDGAAERLELAYSKLLSGDARGELWLGPGDVILVP